jgi:hypothetical protein
MELEMQVSWRADATSRSGILIIRDPGPGQDANSGARSTPSLALAKTVLPKKSSRSL